jgi:hypothetical protein
MDWFAIFKAGKHTDSKGRPFEATVETLDKIIEMNRGREVPIAIGHPETDSPAWGWVNEFKRVGDVLYAKVKELVPEFETWLAEKRYKERSVALNADMTMRHVGFLGAMPPAVDGLPGLTLAAGGDGMMTFAISSESDDLQIDKKEEHAMKKLFALLGLTETATEDDAIAAVKTIRASTDAIVANKGVLGVLELKPEATEGEVVGLITLMKKSHTDIVELRRDNARLEKEIADGNAEDAVNFARVKGKLRKEQESWAMEYAKRDLAGFQEFVNKAPVVDEDMAQKDGQTFSIPGSDVSMDAVQDISRKALAFQAEQAKSGIVLTISEAVGAVTKKRR